MPFLVEVPIPGRQQHLALILEHAQADPELRIALSLYQMGQFEYQRALSAMTAITITTSDKSNPEDSRYGTVDQH
jgi:hypothetical protein